MIIFFCLTHSIVSIVRKTYYHMNVLSESIAFSKVEKTERDSNSEKKMYFNDNKKMY